MLKTKIEKEKKEKRIMRPYNEKVALLEKEHSNYIRHVEKMVARKFYNQNCMTSFSHDRDGYKLTIYLQNSTIIVSFVCKSGFAYFRIISYSDNYQRNAKEFKDITYNHYTNKYIAMNGKKKIIVNDKINSLELDMVRYESKDEIKQHTDLIFLNNICMYAYNKYNLMKSTLYLTHLDASYTLLLINKHQKIFPLDVLKIIIAKLF